MKTSYIPDEEARVLLTACVTYVESYAPILFDCWNQLQSFRKSEAFRKCQLSRRAIHIRRWLNAYRPPQSLARDTPFDNGFDRIHTYERELIRLRTACFILIGLSTGMRLGEIASIKFGCINTEEMRNHGTFYWITSTLYKTERSSLGAPRKWMCGKLAAEAVKVLEQLSLLLGASKETPYLFTTIDQVIGARQRKRRPFKIVTKLPLQNHLNSFCADFGVKIHVHPHMFRRTFARNIVRVDSTSLLALKDHFKHWSLYMTDWYVGLDPDLISEYEAERQVLSIELLEKICVSKVSGAGGRRWTVELERRIKDGRLPRNFRGKAGSEYRKTLITDIHTVGSLAAPCGDFTYCVFNPDEALCTQGHRPIPNKCNPLDCSNSYITEQHVPFHKLKLIEAKASYEGLSESEKQSPLGEVYRREIATRKKMLKPFRNG